MNQGFYVSATDAGKYFPMFGPIDTKAGAEALVDKVSWLARKIDPSGRADFMGWGVMKVTTPNALPMGRINKMVGVQ